MEKVRGQRILSSKPTWTIQQDSVSSKTNSPKVDFLFIQMARPFCRGTFHTVLTSLTPSHFCSYNSHSGYDSEKAETFKPWIWMQMFWHFCLLLSGQDCHPGNTSAVCDLCQLPFHTSSKLTLRNQCCNSMKPHLFQSHFAIVTLTSSLR